MNLGRFFIVARRNLFIESRVVLINISHTVSIKAIPFSLILFLLLNSFCEFISQSSSILSFMGISSRAWWLETAMIELLKVEVSKSSPVVVAWLDGNWQHCIDSFNAVILDYSIHRHHITRSFGLS
jgi:hypothetical protein